MYALTVEGYFYYKDLKLKLDLSSIIATKLLFCKIDEDTIKLSKIASGSIIILGHDCELKSDILVEILVDLNKNII